MPKFILVFAVLLSFQAPAFALDKDDEDALTDTKNLMSNQDALKAFAKDNKDAQKALDQVNQMTGGNKDQNAVVNSIASSEFERIVRANGGDGGDIMTTLQDGLKDPEKFMKNMSPENQARVHKLEAEMNKQNANLRQPSAATTK